MKTYFQNRMKENGLDVTPEQWAVMKAISELPDGSQTDIARLSLKDKANVTRILDCLQKKGYVVREAAPDDRRAVRLRLTVSGAEVLDRLIPLARRANTYYLSNIPATRTAALTEDLKQICRTIEKASR